MSNGGFGDEDFSEEEEESGEEDGELGSESEVSEGEEFVAENARETTSLSSSAKRIKEISIDRLSALPDSLLIHILSFLETGKAASTCVLSKRWRFLWTELPSLEFYTVTDCNNEQTRMFVSMVHSALATHNGNNLERLMVTFYYDKSLASDVDVWIEFVIEKKVNEVGLELHFKGDEYTLPQMMYSVSSLTWLSLEGCIFHPQGTISWRSLTTLLLEDMEIHQHVLEKILSGCPVLESLSLKRCWEFNCLEIDSQNLRTLVIVNWEWDNEALLEISAPYIQSLDITMYLEGRKLRLRNIPSVLTAKFEFGGGDWDDSFAGLMSYTKEIVVGLHHIKKLELGSGSIKVLSMLAASGWQFPQSTRECLIVEGRKDEESVSGILALLESSPNLETLVIKGYCVFWERLRWQPPAKGDLDRDLLHLKTVILTGFAVELDGEPMLKLAKILLKRATVLEKMVIKEYNLSSRNASRDFIKIAKTLLGHPRSSQKAVILLEDVPFLLTFHVSWDFFMEFVQDFQFLLDLKIRVAWSDLTQPIRLTPYFRSSWSRPKFHWDGN